MSRFEGAWGDAGYMGNQEVPMRQDNVWRILAAVVFVASCNSGNQYVASKYFKSQMIDAKQGGTITVTSADSQTLAGTQITVPAGALVADTRIGIAYGKSTGILPAGVQAAGLAVDLGPDGTQFHLPVTVTLPFALPTGGQVDQIVVYALETGGQMYTILNSALQTSSGFVTFNVSGFTQFQLGDEVPPPPGCDAGLTACSQGNGSGCVDVTSDPANCGACGYQCYEGVCTGGVCDGADAGCYPDTVQYFNGRLSYLDLLIVLDTSGGSDENGVLAAEIPWLVSTLRDMNVNFQIGVTTTDVCSSAASENGRLLPCRGCKVQGNTAFIVTGSDSNDGPNLASLIAAVDAGPDSCGAGGPEFFEAAYEALQQANAFGEPDSGSYYNLGLFRPEAAHAVLMVSATTNDDTSPGSVANYDQVFSALIVDPGVEVGLARFSFNYMSPSGLATDGGAIYDNGLPPRLSEMMGDLGEIAVDTLQPSWWDGLSEIVNWSFVQIFPLNTAPIVNTIRIFGTTGALIPATNMDQTVNWTYDATTNAISTNPAELTLSVMDNLEIVYEIPQACPIENVCMEEPSTVVPRTSCFQLCDPFAQDCPALITGTVQGCYYEAAVDSLVCEPSGPGYALSHPCSRSEDECSPGQDCFQLTADELDAGFVRTCRSFCDPSSGGLCPGANQPCEAVGTATGANGASITFGACPPYVDGGN
jgi:hypothetical protein